MIFTFLSIISILLILLIASCLTNSFNNNGKISIFPKILRIESSRWSEEKENPLSKLKWFRNSPSVTVNLTDINMNSYKENKIQELPIFPFDLGQCFPTSNMPLHIFVMKYRQMMNDINLSGKNLFGIVMSTSDGGICEYGTVVENVYRKLLDDGRQFCLNDAKNRFRIIDIISEEPYMIAKVEFDIEDSDVEEYKNTLGKLPDDILLLEKEVWQAIQDIITLNNQILSKLNDSVELSEQVTKLSPSTESNRLLYATDFSFAVSDMLDLTSIERQLLLECNILQDRLFSIKNYLYALRDDLMKKISETFEEPFN